MTVEETAIAETSGASPARPSSPDRQSVAAAFSYCLKVWLPVRIGLLLVGLLGVALLPANDAADVPGWPARALTPGWHNLFAAWERWDALWYLRIATHGYAASDGSAAFFPLYPLLVRGVSFVTGGHPLAAALVVSNVAALAGLVVVFLLTKHELGERRARATVLFLAVFPTSYFLFAPYSESVFLLFAALSLFAARLERWWIAALAGALAAATRSIGVALALPLAFEAFTQLRRTPPPERRWGRATTALLCAAGPIAGIGAYLAYWKAQNGDWLTPFNAQGGWLREFSWPWETLYNGTKAGLQFIGSYPGGYHSLDLVIVAVALAAMVWLTAKWVALKVAGMYVLYALVSFVVPLLLVFGGRPFMSLPRFLVVVWPLFWAFAAFADRFDARDLVVAASAAGLGIMTLLFVNWYFVF